MLGTFVPVFLFAVAQTEISSTISAILNSLTPLNTLWIGILFFAIDFQRRQILGVFIGFLGSLLLVLNGAFVNPDHNYYYAVLLVVASFCYATNVNFLNKYLSDLSPMSITAGSFAILYVPSLIVLYFSGFWQHAQQAEVIEALPYVALLGIVGTGIANVLFFKLLQISSPIFASSVTYLIPIVAFLWGLVDNESLTLIQLLGAIIVMFGVYLSARKK
jgi:drug/metabolite transporter (DMT)-like permease